MNILLFIDTIEPEEYEDWSLVNEQRQRLLDNTERIERTGKTLTEGYRVVLETEQIGAAVLQDLSSQRETIQRSRGRVRDFIKRTRYDYERWLLFSKICSLP